MEAKTNNKILMATRELCYEYWKTNNTMLDYFLLHDFMSIVLEKYEESEDPEPVNKTEAESEDAE